MSQWMPIESAPRDGTVVDLWVDVPDWKKGRRYIDFHYSSDLGMWGRDDGGLLYPTYVTHWMLAPPPPEGGQE